MKLFLLVIQYRSVLAVPLSYTSTVSATRTYIPLIIIGTSLFFLVFVFLAIKLVYMTHRRMGTIHTTPGAVRSTPASSNLDKQGNGHRALFVGCLGSPTWETNLSSKLDGAWPRQQRPRSSFAYQLHTSAYSKSNNSNAGSRFTTSTSTFASYPSHADHLLPSSSVSSRATLRHGSSASKPPLVVQRKADTPTHGPPRYGDFGEFHGVRLPVPNFARRVSPSSIRLVDGPSHSNYVDFAFLAARPPSALLRSPLMGTRDSIQLSRCSLRYAHRPAPPLLSFLPFHLPKGAEHVESRPLLQARELLSPIRFSPLASVVKVFHPQQHVQFEKEAQSSRVPGSGENKNVIYSSVPSLSGIRDASNAGLPTSPCVAQRIPTLHPIRETNTKTNHKRSQSCKGLAIGGTLSRSPLVLGDKRCSIVEPTQPGVLRSPSSSSRNDSVASVKPLKSCLRQHLVTSAPLVGSPDSMFTSSMSGISAHTYGTRRSMGDQASIRTPISDDDIGMLGLDRFRWNDEIKELKERSSHMKKDSVALVPL